MLCCETLELFPPVQGQDRSVMVLFGTLEALQLLKSPPQQLQQTVEVVCSVAALMHHYTLLTSLTKTPQIRIYGGTKIAWHWRLTSIRPREFSQISAQRRSQFKATWWMLETTGGGTMRGPVETTKSVSL